MKKRKPVLLNGEALMADGKPLEFDAVNQEELDGKIDAPQTAAAGEVLTVEEVDEDGKPKKWKAAKISGTFVCTFNEGEDGWITCDKTVEEIITANNDGKDVIGHYYDEIYRLSTPLETGGGYGNPIFSNLGVGVLSIIQYYIGHFEINRIRLSDIAPEDVPDPYEVPVYVPTKDGMRWQYGRPLLATDYFMNEFTDEEKALMQKNLDALPSPATAQVGQIVKVKAVDADGKVIETETIPHPVLYVTISKTGNTNTSDKTFAEIKSAYDSGCSVFAVVDSFVLPLLGILDNMACFCATTPDRELHRVSVLITEFGVSLAYGSFVEGNQGVENAGKILGIGNDGNVVPEDKPVQALAGAAAPTTTTAGVVGQEYYVIVNNAVTEMYVCTSALSGSYTWDKVEFGGAGMDITGAKVGQIAKITAVDSAGKPTAWEPVDMPAVPNDYELVFQETVAEDVGAYSRDTDKDGNPFSLTDVMVIIFTKPFAESTNSVGRGLGFLPTSRWGHDTVSCDIGSSISSANTNSVGRYNVVFVKVVNGYQVVTRAYESQNTTNVFGILMRQTKADNEMFRFHTDATKLMQLDTPQGNITCVKIVGYLNPLVSAGTIVALYKKKGT